MIKKLFLILVIVILLIFSLNTILSCKGKETKSISTDKESAKSGNLIKGQGRALSLKVLQEKVKDCMTKGKCPEDFLQLSGIKRVVGYVIDEKNSDIIMIGEIDDAMPSLYLEDFVIALRNTWLKYAELKSNTYYYSNPGCSIDPDPRILNTLQQVSGQIFSSSNPNKIQKNLNQWHNVCNQQQQVRVLGIPFDTRFGKVMVEADYYAKRLVDGSISIDIDGLSSLTDMTLNIIRNDLDKGGQISVPLVSLNRFWFYPGENSYLEDKGIICIRKSDVKLLTEEEFLTKRGDIAGTGKLNPLAQKFAESFSDKYVEIAKIKPIYAELEGLFRVVALARIMKYKNAIVESGLNLDYLMNDYPAERTPVDRSLPGISNIKEFKRKSETQGGYSILYLWLPSCGGVSIAIDVKLDNFREDRTGGLLELKRRVLQARPSAQALSWNIPSSSPVVQTVRKIKYHGLIVRGRWKFEDEEGLHELDDNGLREYLSSGGRGDNFIVTHLWGTDFERWKKREQTTGNFARSLENAGAVKVFIASDPAMAEKKIDRQLPPVFGNMDIAFDKMVYDESKELNEAINEFKKTGVKAQEIDNVISLSKGNVAIIVAPFSSRLLEQLRAKSRAGLFRDKVVLLMVCGQKGNPENHENYLTAVDEMLADGAIQIVSFEQKIPYKNAASFLKELKRISEKNKNFSLTDVINKIRGSSKDGLIQRLMDGIRHDAKKESPQKYFGGLIVNFRSVS